jgi:hypothetical protein
MIVVMAVLVMLALPAAGQARFLTGIGDQQTEMFGDPLWKQLRTPIARYIAPYDAAVSPDDRGRTNSWIQAATAAHQQILIAFYHSEHSPTRLPSVRTYQRDVQKFIKLFPQVHQYQPWNEANRGNVRRMFSSPSASASASYYAALRKVCRGCTIVGLDVLDSPVIAPTLRYIAQFKSALHRLHVPQPSIWGLHNYSDTNRNSSSRTRAVLAATRGQLWLTETGGIVQFGRDFPNRHGEGLTRASRALKFMFKLANLTSRIKRLYIFQWSGATAAARFDAGLLDKKYNPRAGYVVVCKQLRAAHCNVRVSKH